MRRLRLLLCVIGLGLAVAGWHLISPGSSPAAAAGGQAPTGALPRELRAHLDKESFDLITSVRGLPLGVRDAMQTLFGSRTLDIADPGTAFRVAEEVNNPTLPLRRMLAAGCAPDHHCLVYYERGGGPPTWRVVLYHWTPDETRFEWGAVAPGGLATIQDVRRAVLAGTITEEATLW